MLAAPPADGHEDKRDIDESEDAVDGAENGAALHIVDERAEQQIGGVHEPEDEGRSEARVPGPPNSPDGFGPDGAGDEDDGGEGESGFCGGDSGPIGAGIAADEIES